MTGIVEQLKADFAFIISKYLNDPSSIQQAIKDSRFKSLIIILFRRDVDISKKKYQEMKRLFDYFGADSEIASPKSTISVPARTVTPLQNVVASLIQELANKYSKVKPINNNGLRDLHNELHRAKSSLKVIIGDHLPGRSDGIVKAMHVTTNYLQNLYTKLFCYLGVNPDDIDENSDVFLQWIKYATKILYHLIYNYALANYSKYNRIDDKYFLAFNVGNVRSSQIEGWFLTLHRYLVMTVISLGILQIITNELSQQRNNKLYDMIIGHQQLEYIESQCLTNDIKELLNSLKKDIVISPQVLSANQIRLQEVIFNILNSNFIGVLNEIFKEVSINKDESLYIEYRQLRDLLKTKKKEIKAANIIAEEFTPPNHDNYTSAVGEKYLDDPNFFNFDSTNQPREKRGGIFWSLVDAEKKRNEKKSREEYKTHTKIAETEEEQQASSEFCPTPRLGVSSSV